MEARTLSSTLAALALLAAPAIADTRLSGDEIRQTVAGKRIYLATPLGGELPLNYGTDGRVDGSGEAIGLARFFQPKDSGRWWIAGNRLCQKWQQWYKGETICFTLERRGANRLFWRRDNGESGLARIAGR